MNLLHLASASSRAPSSDVIKPETIVIGEMSGNIRERIKGEIVHHKKRPGQTRCLVCHEGGSGKFLVWLSSREAHEDHTFACS